VAGNETNPQKKWGTPKPGKQNGQEGLISGQNHCQLSVWELGPRLCGKGNTENNVKKKTRRRGPGEWKGSFKDGRGKNLKANRKKVRRVWKGCILPNQSA